MTENFSDYKFGQPFYGTIPDEEKEKAAKMFGEGSPQLTELLDFCFNNGIKTFASCKGHKEKGTVLGVGYIGFSSSENFTKYLCELSDQIPTKRIIADKYMGELRTTVYVDEEYHFVPLLNMIKKYEIMKQLGYKYKTRFSNTDRIIDMIINSNDSDFFLLIDNGQYEVVDDPTIFEVENGQYYCPNASTTHILHSRYTLEMENSFKKEENTHSSKN